MTVRELFYAALEPFSFTLFGVAAAREDLVAAVCALGAAACFSFLHANTMRTRETRSSRAAFLRGVAAGERLARRADDLRRSA